MLNIPRIISFLGAGPASEDLFRGEESTGGSRLAAGVRVGGGQPGSSARARCSLAADQPCDTRVSHGGEARGYAGRRMVAAKGTTRLSGGGPQNRPPPEKPGTVGFRANTSVPIICCGAATRSACWTNPSPSHTKSYPSPIDRLP
jgi:hypothetical protein